MPIFPCHSIRETRLCVVVEGASCGLWGNWLVDWSEAWTRCHGPYRPFNKLEDGWAGRISVLGGKASWSLLWMGGRADRSCCLEKSHQQETPQGPEVFCSAQDLHAAHASSACPGPHAEIRGAQMLCYVKGTKGMQPVSFGVLNAWHYPQCTQPKPHDWFDSGDRAQQDLMEVCVHIGTRVLPAPPPGSSSRLGSARPPT